jgi:hypothetical protein
MARELQRGSDMKTNADLAAILHVSVDTISALIEGLMFDFVGHRESPMSAFNAADVNFALDGGVQLWETILLNESMKGCLVAVGRGFYKVAEY